MNLVGNVGIWVLLFSVRTVMTVVTFPVAEIVEFNYLIISTILNFY